ncbi:MAG: hypothetical protein J6M90_01585 [Oscillospiraceae bacterium]|nr:hypothetical protein [Oscillospiraceae bacterium]
MTNKEARALLKDYADKVAIFTSRKEKIIDIVEREPKYRRAMDLYTVHRYADCIPIFCEIVGYKNTNEFLEKSKNIIEQERIREENARHIEEEYNRIRNVTYDYLFARENGETATEILEGCKELSGVTNQKLTYVLRELVANGQLIKATIRGKTYYSIN